MAILGNELLTGALVKLTAIQRTDIPDVTEWQNDMEYQRLLRRALVTPTHADGVEEWFKHALPDDNQILFAIRRLTDNQLIGMCGIKDISWQARHCEIWIGIGRPGMRGHGLGTDALRVLVRYAFMEMNLNRVGLVVSAFNDRAQKSYAKVGFREEGRMREYVFRDGVYYDLIQMGLLRSEWQDIR